MQPMQSHALNEIMPTNALHAITRGALNENHATTRFVRICARASFACANAVHACANAVHANAAFAYANAAFACACEP
eukprot:1932269-Lingulodinium_polyedra.AAC.1